MSNIDIVSTDNPDDLGIGLGLRLRSRRIELSLTLRETAVKTGLSMASISQIERNVTAPSLRSLRLICAALSMSMGELFVKPAATNLHDGDGDIVLRSGTRPSINLGAKGIVKELLTPSTLKNIQAMTISIEPGHGSGTVPLTSEAGERAGIVIRGSLGIEVDGRKVYLEQGDSFGVCASESIRFWCASEMRCEVIWMTSPSIY